VVTVAGAYLSGGLMHLLVTIPWGNGMSRRIGALVVSIPWLLLEIFSTLEVEIEQSKLGHWRWVSFSLYAHGAALDKSFISKCILCVAILTTFFQDGTLMCTMDGHKSVVSTLSVCDEVLYSGSWDGTVRLWSVNDHSPLAVLGEDLPGELKSILAITASRDLLVAACENGCIKVSFFFRTAFLPFKRFKRLISCSPFEMKYTHSI